MRSKLNMKKNGDRPEKLARVYREILVHPKKKLFGKRNNDTDLSKNK